MQLVTFHCTIKHKKLCATSYYWPLLNTQLSSTHPLLHIHLGITDFISVSTK